VPGSAPQARPTGRALRRVARNTRDLRTNADRHRSGYAHALKLSAIDNDIADSEIDFLGRLRVGLGPDEATAERIEDGIASA
jgi:hypothetical protein